MKKLLLAAIVCSLVLCVGFAGAGAAGAATPTLKSLAKAVAALQKKTKTLSAQLSAAKTTIDSQAQTIASLQGKLAADEATIAGLGTTVTGLSTTVAGHTQTLSNAAPLLAIAPYVRLDTTTINGVAPPHIIFEGANVHVRSAEDETDSTGTGNLIVGWNDEPSTVQRTGSNNLVAGVCNNFASHGGFVCGSANTLTGDFASVSGGSSNIASGLFASVSGGGHNTASSNFASISGGANNVSSSDYASVSGGRYNVANGSYTSILGGGAGNPSEGNVATGMYSAIVGGRLSRVTIDGQWGVVCGGYSNSVSCNVGTVGGGYNLSLSGYVNAWAAGGPSQAKQFLTYDII